MPKKLIIISVFILLSVGLGVGLYLVQTGQIFRPQATANTVFYFEPADSTIALTEPDFTLAVVGDPNCTDPNDPPNCNKILSLDAVVNYDPELVELTGVDNGDFFGASQVVIGGSANTSTPGVITYSAYTGDNTNPATQVGTIMTLHFRATNVGNPQIVFNTTQTLAYGEGEGNVLKDMINPFVDIVPEKQPPTEIPTATPPFDTPTPTPGDTDPNLTSTPTPSPTVTTAPSATPTQGGTGGSPSSTPTTAPPAATNTSAPSGSTGGQAAAPSTAPDELPQAGTTLPTMIALSLGSLLLILGIALVL